MDRASSLSILLHTRMLASSFVPMSHLLPRTRLPRDGSEFDAQECKKALITWAARATDVKEAAAQLDAWKASLQFVELFKKYFPDQYAELASRPNEWTLDPHTRIAPIESRFFALADQHLFPFNTDCMEMIFDEMRHGEDLIPFIPLYSLLPQPDEWDSDVREYDAVRVLFCFTWNNWCAPDEDEWQALQIRFAERGVALPMPIWYPWRGEAYAYRDETRVRDALILLHQGVFFDMASAAGFDWLRTGMDVLFRDSGNVLVDFDEEITVDLPEWSEENVEWLAGEWQVGETLMTVFWNGLHQLTAQPALCAQLIELWNESWLAAPRAIATVRG